MLTRLLAGVIGVAGAALFGGAAVAGAQPNGAQPAQPDPPPVSHSVNVFAPVSLSEYAVMDGQWYAFATPDGLTCVLQRSGSYGCSGPLPGAPNGANLVSGGPGVPGFARTDGDVFAVVGEAKLLPPGSRISYQTVSCGTDGTVTTCEDSRIQSGFVISPAGSYIINGGRNPLLDRPEGTNPFFN